MIPGFLGSFWGAAADARERRNALWRKGSRAFARVTRPRRFAGSNLPPSACDSNSLAYSVPTTVPIFVRRVCPLTEATMHPLRPDSEAFRCNSRS